VEQSSLAKQGTAGGCSSVDLWTVWGGKRHIDNATHAAATMGDGTLLIGQSETGIKMGKPTREVEEVSCQFRQMVVFRVHSCVC
jgi:hypothetical protein